MPSSRITRFRQANCRQGSGRIKMREGSLPDGRAPAKQGLGERHRREQSPDRLCRTRKDLTSKEASRGFINRTNYIQAIVFKVPDRGSVNPTALAGMGILGCGIDCGDGIVQTRRPHGLGTVWDCKYHLVWITKYRYPVFGGDVGHRCRELIRETSGGHEMVIRAGSINRDHVHLLLSVPPNLSVSRSVQYLKGRSSDKLLREFGALRKRYWGQHLWARGYWVTSMRERNGRDVAGRHHEPTAARTR